MNQSVWNPLALSGRRFLVSGAASGIGQATAILLSQLGATVMGVDLDEAGLAQTQPALAGEGHHMLPVDLSDLPAIPKWLESLAETQGRLHGLVHAAGVQATVPFRQLSHDKWRQVFLVNTEAGLALAKGFLARNVYAGEHGSIVFISSVMGAVSLPGLAAYSLSKGALEGAMRALALELAPKGIRVNAVAPAFVRTRMFENMQKLWTPEQSARLESQHPLGIGTPEDVAHAVVFLLSDAARWITGTRLVVDGGYTAQ